MVPFIACAREHHRVRTPEEYLGAHRRFIEKQAAAGLRYEVHESRVIVTARVCANQWVVDCECGAGNATDPEWVLACCFGCGAIHRNILFPPDRERSAIEALLLARLRPRDRHWLPGESVGDLTHQNDHRDGGRMEMVS